MKLLITGGSGFIGTNLINEYVKKRCEILNLDIKKPYNNEHNKYWRLCDILARDKLQNYFNEFQPTHVIHLAARTDCIEDVDLYKEYDSNITGTQNVLDVINETSSIERVIITSSQYVCGPTYYPKNMDDYKPHTTYGHSKVITEKMTKESDLSCVWTIIRPTNIWGPWHMRYRREAWNVIRKGMYMHPGGGPVIRCYGYVGTVIEYINKIIDAPSGKINKKVFYVGDVPIDIYDWANGFSQEIIGKQARRVPRMILKCIGIFGDIWDRILKRQFPLNSSRYKNMITDYLTPMDLTFAELGEPVTDWRKGIKETVHWLNQYGWPE